MSSVITRDEIIQCDEISSFAQPNSDGVMSHNCFIIAVLVHLEGRGVSSPVYWLLTLVFRLGSHALR